MSNHGALIRDLLFSLCMLGITACQPNMTAPTLSEEKIPSQTTSATQTTSEKPLKVITPDWAIAATLTAMGFSPLATGDVRTYPDWVADPTLPADMLDLGARFAPNPELFAQLQADIVIDNDFYAHLRPLYGRIAHTAVNFTPKNAVATWADYSEPTRQLGNIIHQPQAAEAYLQKAQLQLQQSNYRFKQRFPYVQKLTVVQFADSNNLRLYGHNSLFEPTLAAMDITLQVPPALGEPNAWGFLSIQLGDLAKLDTDTCLVVVAPFSPMLQKELNENQLWQRMGYGKTRCMAILPPLWTYGGVPSMLTFSQRLVTAEFTGLTTRPSARGSDKGVASHAQ